ncbi:MAG: hypothetical protein JXL97_01230 [Bacteroidales bacterium]|nr:hypothetical protein [Bacteroidales bacterium]
MNRKFILIGTILLFSVQLFSQKISIRAIVDTNIIEFANQTTLRIQVQADKSNNLFFPQFKDTIGDGVEFVEEFPVDTINENPFTVEKAYTITSFKDSIRTIPQLPVIVNTDTIWTHQIQILVTPLNIDSSFVADLDTTQIIPIFGIKKPMDAPFTFKEFWLRFGRWILLALGIIALITVLYWVLYRIIKNQPIKILEKPKEPAHIIAFRKLEELKNKKIFEQENSKEYYSELTGILKTYIEHRFRIAAVEQTSTEILNSFNHIKLIDIEQFDALRAILNTADLAKFAKYNPLQNINETNFDLTYKFVDKTKIVIEEIKGKIE